VEKSIRHQITIAHPGARSCQLNFTGNLTQIFELFANLTMEINMRTFDTITQLLLIVGGLNWLLVGAFQFDLVAAIFGGQTTGMARLVYVIVGICAIWQLIRLPALMNSSPVVSRTVDRP
jgi:uncharacterized protein